MIKGEKEMDGRVKYAEVCAGLMTVEQAEYLSTKTEDMAVIEHSERPILLGEKALLKVNTNIGVSDEAAFENEYKKLHILAELPYRPDTMMDHTYVQLPKPFWKYMVNTFDGPVGTLPHYYVYRQNRGIDAVQLLETIDEMGAEGVRFMTLHPTATRDLLEVARTCRSIPTTSRGGALVLRDLEVHKRSVNVFADCFDEILKLFKKYHMTLSVGTTFRPARIDEALDQVHLDEIQEQKKYIDIAKACGVHVIMEGIGHLSLRDIPRYCELIRNHHTPLMPLGPMVTDASIGFDHVTSAIGAAAAAMNGNVCTINSVTREEHTGGVPTCDSIVEGLKTARVVAHSINLLRFNKYWEIDRAISDQRAASGTCVIKGGIFGENVSSVSDGCNRCRYECPLNILQQVRS